MHTARSLTVSPSMPCSGGRVSGPGAGRGGGLVVSQHALRQTPPLRTESQTPVKILACPNFVVGGNYVQIPFIAIAILYHPDHNRGYRTV